MNFEYILDTYHTFYEKALSNRYITYKDIAPLEVKHKQFTIQKIGKSVQQNDIVSYRIGTGKIKVLLWSQMHGNESTSTKALFDLFNFLQEDSKDAKRLLSNMTLLFIPMLNPDGAERYTRLNSNLVDLNRDAVALSQPESNVLRTTFDSYKPDICFNLHGQRTIFSAGSVKKSASLSFLSPSQDVDKTITPSRKLGMRIISEINNVLQQYLPNQIGRYDDGHNINCVGDKFQSLNVPTLLYEAGHIDKDYSREEVRKYFLLALLAGLESISNDFVTTEGYKHYFDIPENEKLFCDVILKNAHINNESLDIGLQFEEVLVENSIQFNPKVTFLSANTGKFGHQEIDCSNKTFNKELSSKLILDNEVKFLTFDNENIIKMLKKTVFK